MTVRCRDRRFVPAPFDGPLVCPGSCGVFSRPRSAPVRAAVGPVLMRPHDSWSPRHRPVQLSGRVGVGQQLGQDRVPGAVPAEPGGRFHTVCDGPTPPVDRATAPVRTGKSLPRRPGGDPDTGRPFHADLSPTPWTSFQEVALMCTVVYSQRVVLMRSGWDRQGRGRGRDLREGNRPSQFGITSHAAAHTLIRGFRVRSPGGPPP